MRVKWFLLSLLIASIALLTQAADLATTPGIAQQSDLTTQAEFQAGAEMLPVEPGVSFERPLPDGVIRVNQSTLKEYTDALGPIPQSGNYPLSTTIRVCLPWPFDDTCWRETVTLCAGHWDATVSNINVAIRGQNESILIAAQLSGTYQCITNIQFGQQIQTTGNVYYNPTSKVVTFTANPTSIYPIIHVFGYTYQLPYRINIAPPMTFTLPISTAFFHFETASGAKSLRLTPEDVMLSKKSGLIELQANVLMW